MYQSQDNQKLTIKGSIPNIQTTIDDIKQITQCKYSNTCTFGLNCKFNHEQLNIVEFYKGVLQKDRSEIKTKIPILCNRQIQYISILRTLKKTYKQTR